MKELCRTILPGQNIFYNDSFCLPQYIIQTLGLGNLKTLTLAKLGCDSEILSSCYYSFLQILYSLDNKMFLLTITTCIK